MKKTNSPYSAAFTAGALLYQEMNSVLPLLMQEDGEALLKKDIEDNLYLHIASINTRKRYVPELIRRYNTVPDTFWKDFMDFSLKAQKVALFYVVLKTYQMIWDFHIQVAMPKWKSFDPTISKDDLSAKYDEIAQNDEFVAGWSEKTKDKVMSVYLHMLHQAGLRKEGTTELKQPELGIEEYAYYLKIGEPWFLDACLLHSYQIESIKNEICE